MGITVTIQTYNRAEELRKTLHGLAAVDTRGVPEFEILIVDNNSTDHTAAVVEEQAPAFQGKLRYVYETRLGLSHARNRAVAEARYEVIGFLDDDVDVDVNWLRSIAETHKSDKYAVVGGRAYLVYPKPRPQWLDARSEGLLTRVEHGPEARPAHPHELYGVNLSYRKKWIELVGGFRSDLGRVGSCLLSSEETDINGRIAAAGGKLLYEPAAVVGHRVPLARLRRRWFWSRCYWSKIGDARTVPEPQVNGYELLRHTSYLGRAGWGVANGLFRHRPGSEEFFHRTWVLAGRLGFWVGFSRRYWGRKSRRGVHRLAAPGRTVAVAAQT